MVAPAVSRLRSRRVGSRRRRTRVRARDRNDDHAPFRCEHPDALVELVQPFTRSIGALDFWTEAALLAQHGIDAIVIGPGDIARAHAPDEFVELDDLDWAIELLRAAMRQPA
jgi:2-keto-3-deoxy-L-rhamnonate aldolase RhmA